MSYFEVMLSGKGISLPFAGTSDVAIGFYVSRIVRARAEAEAQDLAKSVVSAEWCNARFSSNQGASPTLAVESVSRISLFRGLFRRQPGYSFYSDKALPNYSLKRTAEGWLRYYHGRAAAAA